MNLQLSKKTGEAGLIEDLGALAWYPYEFAYYAYPWGEQGTTLEHFGGCVSTKSCEFKKNGAGCSKPAIREYCPHFRGLEGWQAEVLQEVGIQVRANMFDGITPVKPVRILVASGHGIGKSAENGIIADWIRSTRPHSKGTVTANTKSQLKTKTWAEMRKWGRMSVTANWFSFKAESISHVQYPEWRQDMETSNEDNSESFAGQHTATSTSHYLIDEGSTISDKIMEVVEGGLVRGEPMVFIWGNPTKNSGVFHEIHRGKKRKFWFVLEVDSRTAKMTNKVQIKEWIDEYGLDSDFVRVRVLGKPPKADSLEFITKLIAKESAARKISKEQYLHAPIIIGADPAWQGEDYHVIVKRQGLYSQLIGKWRHLPYETVGFTNLLAKAEDEHKADAVFIDMHGIGGAVYDNMTAMGRTPILVNSNATDIEKPLQFRNARMEMWYKLRKWMMSGGSIPDDPLCIQDVSAPYAFLLETGTHAGKYILESKKDMRARGLDSPGTGDALAYTFYQPVVRQGYAYDDIKFDNETLSGYIDAYPKAKTKYNVFARN
jgi:hypothetical protein